MGYRTPINPWGGNFMKNSYILLGLCGESTRHVVQEAALSHWHRGLVSTRRSLRQQGSWCQHGAHLGPVGPRWTHVGPMNLAIRVQPWNHRSFMSARTPNSWWRHQMETLSALLAICAGNSLVTGDFPYQRPVTWSFDVFFDLRLNKHWWGWWFETPSRPLWRHCNVLHVIHTLLFWLGMNRF